MTSKGMRIASGERQSKPGGPDAPRLVIEDLRVEFSSPFGVVRVLRGVSFTVGASEIVGVVGESGSGKSVTANAIMRLLPRQAAITGGRVLYEGVDLVQQREVEMRMTRGNSIGMVFQDPMTTLNPVMKVGKQIDEAIRLHQPRFSRKQARLRTVEMLSAMGVSNASVRAEQYPHQWSGGLRQRAVLAMAMINSPALLIADEPTTALDSTIQAEVLDVIERAQRMLGMSVLLITHDLGVVNQLASRVIVMYAGRIVEVASTADLHYDSRHPYSRALIASRPGAVASGAKLVTIPGRPPSLTLESTGCPFAPRCTFPLKDSRCESEEPSLLASADGRLSACHFRDVPVRES